MSERASSFLPPSSRRLTATTPVVEPQAKANRGEARCVAVLVSFSQGRKRTSESNMHRRLPSCWATMTTTTTIMMMPSRRMPRCGKPLNLSRSPPKSVASRVLCTPWITSGRRRRRRSRLSGAAPLHLFTRALQQHTSSRRSAVETRALRM